MEETHNLKGMSLIPSTRYWMDIVSRKFVLRFLLFVLKITKCRGWLIFSISENNRQFYQTRLLHSRYLLCIGR